jgi:hypothetical protein
VKQPALAGACAAFTETLIGAYAVAARENLPPRDTSWPSTVCARAYLYVGTLLAARGFGPFAYAMSDAARDRLAGLARSLTMQPPANVKQYCERLFDHIGVAELAAE